MAKKIKEESYKEIGSEFFSLCQINRLNLQTYIHVIGWICFAFKPLMRNKRLRKFEKKGLQAYELLLDL